jgi:hypothetical protein
MRYELDVMHEPQDGSQVFLVLLHDHIEDQP